MRRKRARKDNISLLLHSSATTIQKYLCVPEDSILETKIITQERQHQEELLRKQVAIEEVGNLYEYGNSIEEITRKTCHTHQAVKKYLKDECPLSNGHYADRRQVNLRLTKKKYWNSGHRVLHMPRSIS